MWVANEVHRGLTAVAQADPRELVGDAAAQTALSLDRPPQHATVVWETQRDVIAVEALQERLGVWQRGAELVAQPGHMGVTERLPADDLDDLRLHRVKRLGGRACRGRGAGRGRGPQLRQGGVRTVTEPLSRGGRSAPRRRSSIASEAFDSGGLAGGGDSGASGGSLARGPAGAARGGRAPAPRPACPAGRSSGTTKRSPCEAISRSQRSCQRALVPRDYPRRRLPRAVMDLRARRRLAPPRSSAASTIQAGRRSALSPRRRRRGPRRPVCPRG